MESALFAKLCKECHLVSERLTVAQVDLVFGRTADKVRWPCLLRKRVGCVLGRLSACLPTLDAVCTADKVLLRWEGG